MNRKIFTYLTAALLASACAVEDGEPADEMTDGAGGKADQISGNDDPSGLLAPERERLLAQDGLASCETCKGELGMAFVR